MCVCVCVCVYLHKCVCVYLKKGTVFPNRSVNLLGEITTVYNVEKKIDGFFFYHSDFLRERYENVSDISTETLVMKNATNEKE